MNPRLLTRTLAAAALALAAGLVQAAPVTYAFSGVVDDDEAGRGLRTFAGSFTFDSAAPDAWADPKSGYYINSGAPWGLTVAFDGGAALTFDNSLVVGVSNDSASLGRDRWSLVADGGTQSVVLVFTDLTALLFSNDAQPLVAGGLTLADFGTTELRWTAGDTLFGHMDALACTSGCDAELPLPLPHDLPEPPSLVLAVMAMTLALRHSRRRAA